MTNPPPPPPPGNYPPPPPPPPPGGGYNPPPPPPPPPGGGYNPPPPPPPGGGYPPPPPPQGGYAPPPVGGGGPGALPQDAYTPWVTRVLAWLIDSIPVAIIIGIGWIILLTTQECVDLNEAFGGDYSEYGFSGQVCGASTIGQLSISLFSFLGFAFAIWNYGYKQGTTGSSIGKGIMKFKVVSEETGQPIGFAMSVVRQLAHFIDSIICYIGYLFPLWDQKRQTIADKLLKTVCLPL